MVEAGVEMEAGLESEMKTINRRQHTHTHTHQSLYTARQVNSEVVPTVPHSSFQPYV